MSKSKTLHDLGEREVIRRLTSRLPGRDDVRVGAGDDAAVVAVEGGAHDLLLTSDPVIEGVHFKSGEDPTRVGHKAVGRVLSDLAAMGGEAQWVLLDVVAPGGTEAEYLERLYEGAVRLTSKCGAAIVGGDTAEGPTLELHVFAVGRVPRGEAVLREGAAAGDLIHVTGTLGGSYAGKHLSFDPRLKEGAWLRERQWATAMIDVSDGLATDLRHIMARSRLGAALDRERIPLSEVVLGASAGAYEHALYDGEDFELLFTIEPGRQAEFEQAWREAFDLRCTRIGVMTDEDGRMTVKDERGMVEVETGRAYEHFSRRKA